MADPERRCLVTGKSGPAEKLVRFVLDPEGHVVPDLAGKLPGRGYWVTASRAAIEEAVRKRLFIRAAGRAGKIGADFPADRVQVDPLLADRVENLLLKSCLDLLGLARRVGLVTLGFEKVRESLAADTDAVLVTAADGGADGRAKLVRPGRRVVTLFTRDELSLALGRENVVHAALRLDRLGARFLAELDRLSGFRDAEDNIFAENMSGHHGQSADADDTADGKTTEF